ncbi:tetratricopeptide repeat protein [Streptomyces sp. NPDC015220]|uniref:tetratricopeptide repeat protein n=1 Tax=Streptomyces sp. NPDC015220 TaxID=3364947 RepID=UPI0036FBC00F
MSLAIGHLVTQYRTCLTLGGEPFSEAVAAALEELCARLGEVAHDTEQLVFDDPALVLDELGRALARIADVFAGGERHEDELLARRIALALHPAAHTPSYARDLSALAGPLSALGRTAEALDARREACSILCELAVAGRGRPAAALAEAEAYAGLLAEAGDPAAAVEAYRRAVDALAPYAGPGPEWAARTCAAAVGRLAQASADADDPDTALALAQEAVALLERRGDPAELADAVRMVGLLHEKRQHWDEARARLAEAVGHLADATEDTDILVRRAEVLADLSRVQARLDDGDAPDTAAQCVELCRGLARDDAGRLPLLARALVELHHRLAESGRHIKAVYAAQEAAELYGRLLAEEEDEEWAAELARTRLHLGRRLADAGRLEPALEETRTAVRLLRDHVDDPFELGVALKDLGTRLHELRRLEESLDATGEAARTFRAANELPALAATLYNLAVTHNVADHAEETVRAAAETVETYQRLYDEDSGWAPGLAQALGLLGTACERVDRFDQAITAMERAVSLLERLHSPDEPQFAFELARILHDLSRYHEEQGRLERALEHMRRSVSLYGELTQHEPERFRDRLAGAWLSLGIYLSRLGRAEEARSATGLAADLYRRTDDRQSLALALSQLASRESALDHDEAGAAALTEAIELYEELALEQPGFHGPHLAKALEDLAAHHCGEEEYRAALPLLERSTALWERLGDPASLADGLRSRLLVHCCLGQDTEDVLDRLAEAQRDPEETVRTLDGVVAELIGLNRLEPAEHLLTRAFGLWEIHLLEHPDGNPVLRPVLLDSRAMLLARDGRHAEAAAVQEETVRLLEPPADDDPAGFLSSLAAARSRLCDYLRAAGRPAEALDHQDRVVSAYERLAAGDPGRYRPALVSSLHELGLLLREMGHADADAVLARAATLRLTLEGEQD